MRYLFDDFELDTQRYELRQAGSVQPLEPQGFNVLAYLLEHRDRVVSKSELLERLWPNQYVSEATLTQRLVAVRRALGDDGRTQRYIRTVHGRGYRFVAAIVGPAEPVSLPPGAAVPLPRPTVSVASEKQTGMFVGREAEIALLQERLALALRGERQLVFVSGEAGIGKTTLVDAFVEQVQARSALWLGRGQCVEQYGAGEAYLPLLEALGRLGRGPAGAHLTATLRQRAPSWLGHLPALVSAAEGTALQSQSSGLTRERMLRELAEALEGMTATQPLLIVLEDLHWSDVSTVDWLTYVARRRDPAKLLILGTYRPTDALAHSHPLRLALQELQRHGQALDIRLPYWSIAEVTTYLVQCFGTLPCAADMVHLLHQRTRGNPFFLAAVVEAMAPQDILAGLERDVDALPAEIPESIRHLIEFQLDTLPEEDQALLEIASVAGESFVTTAVAACMEHTVDVVERRCDALVRKGHFLHALGLETWPDATVGTRYGFRHALYQEVLYERLPPGRRLRLHQQLGLLKERAYGDHVREIAAELAMHFGRSQESLRSVQYLHMAAQNALQRCAYQEGIAYLTQGLELLQTVPDSPTRQQHELLMQSTLGMAYTATKGYAAPEVECTYTRARELCARVGDRRQMFAALVGLWGFSFARGTCQTARQLGEQLVALAQQTEEPRLQLLAHATLGETWFHLGNLPQARLHLEQALAFSHLPQPRAQAPRPPTVVCLAYAAWTLWQQGYAEQAMQRCEEARALAHDLSHPLSLTVALGLTGILYQFRGEVQAAQAWSVAATSLSLEYGFPFWEATTKIVWGWTQVFQDAQAAGLARMQEGLRMLQTARADIQVPSWLALLAEAYGYTGQVAAGHQTIDAALTMLNRTDERYYEAELYRLKGDLYMQQPHPEPARAESCLQQALTLARQRGARAWELRAALSLGRLWHGQGKHAAARQLVGDIYGWFTEGFDTVDLQAAKAFLEN